MKRITDINNTLYLVIVLIVAIASFSSCKNQEEPQKKENTFQAKFTATPNSFSGLGGVSEISGVLQEITPEGEIVSETPLKPNEFELALRGYYADIRLDRYNSKNVIVDRSDRSHKFMIEAIVTNGKGKGCKEELYIKRGGSDFSFRAEPSRVPQTGGNGKVLGVWHLTDYDGKILESHDLLTTDFDLKYLGAGLSSPGETEGVTIDSYAKTFTIEAGEETSIKLKAIAWNGKGYVVEIKREG